MFSIYKTRGTFTAAEAAALIAGVIPTDSLKAAIAGHAPCDTPEAVQAREAFGSIRWGYERAISRYRAALDNATDAAGIRTAIEAAHSEALPHYNNFSSGLSYLLKESETEPFDKLVSTARFLYREAVNTLADDAFEKLHFEREYIATWLTWLELKSAYPFAPAETVQEQPAPPPAPVQRTAAQDAAILRAIRGLGYNPQNLPKHAPGKAGVKAEIRDTLKVSPLFAGTKVFDKA